MNPAQNYIFQKPEPFQSILLHLDGIITLTIPEVTLKYKWHLPFYYLNDKMFCFLNFRKKFVDLGIPYGDELSDTSHLLIAGEGRKKLRSLQIYTVEDINDNDVIEVLTELSSLKKFV
ncbi:DUF1801 domain-containing protein [Aquimarina sp. ERC-38]|uniref:DUF1801 domain-containing protein n=1 Tax=Aquimarina sp. ERC-38 TaxID=2949996 RepID=UPI0022472ADD|nr:DUF1801 domain-containing protein [Aquimarina sp. ERC-38]UZO80834.1 DUF1801 domain-containing protein [Aquimarina sp. ERC-38]